MLRGAPRKRPLHRFFRLLAAFMLLGAGIGEAAPAAHEVASGLARLGPRPEGSPAQEKAAELLLAAMRRAGLRQVRAVPAPSRPSLVNLEGVLPGETDGEIVLSAHYDTVKKSPGAGDDASGCGTAIAAAADLARTPLRHTVRVVLFDGEESGLLGSRAWAAALGPAGRDRILAAVNLEMLGWNGSAGPTIHTFPVKAGEERVVAPGWLVHALLRSGEAVGWPYEMSDARASFLAQLVLRSARVRLGADSDPLLALGVPALSLSDTSLLSFDPAYHRPTDTAARLDAGRLAQWSAAVAAAVRRLDHLAGRPIAEDDYLVLFGRVWLRRDLAWIGFLLWILLVFRGRPGRWRGTPEEERLRQGRRYLPGFAFRILFLLALFIAPVFAVLLFPAALLALVPPRGLWTRLLWAFLGLLPLLIYLAALGGAFALGLASWKAGFQGGWGAAAVILGAFAAYVLRMVKPREFPLEPAPPLQPAEP